MRFFKFKTLVWFSALALASCAGYYSVFGLSQLFHGAWVAVIVMASFLEFSKVVLATVLHRYWASLALTMRSYLTIGLVTLMVITSAGIYGFLSNAYQGTATKLEQMNAEKQVLENRKLGFEKRISYIEGDNTTLQSRIESLSGIRTTQESSLSRLYSDTNARYSSIQTMNRNISEADASVKALFEKVDSNSVEIRELTDSVATYDQRILELANSNISAEIGPLIYLSNLTGFDMDYIINWFILMIVFVFDPLAVSLVLVANHIRKVELDEAIGVENHASEEKSSEDINEDITDQEDGTEEVYKVEHYTSKEDNAQVQSNIGTEEVPTEEGGANEDNSEERVKEDSSSQTDEEGIEEEQRKFYGEHIRTPEPKPFGKYRGGVKT